MWGIYGSPAIFNQSPLMVYKKGRNKLNIAVIDADLIGRSKHRFPNLACEKISGFYKSNGHHVELKTSYENLEVFDQVFISKVFTDTWIPEWLQETDNIHLGGTGFFFDKAPDLPYEIEHSFPDYGLYDDWIAQQISNGVSRNDFKEYLDYSIGFLTRGCFRKCGFCVNQKYDHVFPLNYKSLPYIMRYQSATESPWEKSKYRGMYVTLARWCNQPSYIKKMSFREFCQRTYECGCGSSSIRYMNEFENEHQNIADKYFDLKWGEIHDLL